MTIEIPKLPITMKRLMWKIVIDGIQCQGIEVLSHLKHRPKVRGAALNTAPACGIGSSWISCDDGFLREVTDW